MTPTKIALINTAKVMLGGLAIGIGVNVLFNYVSPVMLLSLFILLGFIGLSKIVYDIEKRNAENQEAIRKSFKD